MRAFCPAVCALLPAWLCVLIGLLPAEIQSRALTLHSLTYKHRLYLPKTSKLQKSSLTIIAPTNSELHVTIDNRIPGGDSQLIWRTLLYKEPPPKVPDPFLDQRDGLQERGLVWRRGSRGRRHAVSGYGRGHVHLMRAGCVLGTCQVQNLSHRLYQLIGQSGREDTSPINPRSPHSYG